MLTHRSSHDWSKVAIFNRLGSRIKIRPICYRRFKASLHGRYQFLIFLRFVDYGLREDQLENIVFISFQLYKNKLNIYDLKWEMTCLGEIWSRMWTIEFRVETRFVLQPLGAHPEGRRRHLRIPPRFLSSVKTIIFHWLHTKAVRNLPF